LPQNNAAPKESALPYGDFLELVGLSNEEANQFLYRLAHSSLRR
jgi:hypothetical protein